MKNSSTLQLDKWQSFYNKEIKIIKRTKEELKRIKETKEELKRIKKALKKELKAVWYNNKMYTISGGYYKNGNAGLLHRNIYRDYIGEIPKGYIIHHINCNKLDNNLSNLQCMTNSQHMKLHRHIEILVRWYLALQLFK